MNIYNLVKEKIISIVYSLAKEYDWHDINIAPIVVEIPANPSHGDMSSNAAMVIAKSARTSPREIASLIEKCLKEDSTFSSACVAGAGFINMRISGKFWQEELNTILSLQEDYGKSDIGAGKKINIEFVSPNPTGPIHIGTARSAVYGDVLASLLTYTGHNVTKECYINDAGNQIDVLVKSLHIRYMQVMNRYSGDFPEMCYPGEYLIDAAKALHSKHDDKFSDITVQTNYDFLREFAINFMLDMIKNSLKSLGVSHDVFFHEINLHKENKISEAVDFLESKGLIYRGILEVPKGNAEDDWEEREQLLFKTTEYGDDVDRPLQKSNGMWTYFAAEIAYVQNKLDRGFSDLICVLGADHVGYQKRMLAACKALNNDDCILDIKLCQLVSFLKDGKPFKMSKRSGNFLSVDEVLEIVSKDIIRFMMLTRKNDVTMDFDFAKVREQSKDNPVFYVQYAYARGFSVLSNSISQMPEISEYLGDLQSQADLSLISSDRELDLMKYLSYWPKHVEVSALASEPHKIVFYLQALAAKFHSFWNVGKNESDMRFIIKDNLELTKARLALVKATMIVIGNGLKIIGVTPAKRM